METIIKTQWLRGLVLMALMLTAGLRAAAEDDAVITDIGKQYHQALTTIKQHKRTAAKHDMVTTMRYEVPGKGAAVETLHFFFNLEQFGENGEFVNYQLFFVTRQLRLAGRHYYEEYLYDNRSGQLAFAVKRDYDSAGKRVEKRFYYRDGTIYRTTGAPLGQYEDDLTMMLSQDYRHAFDNLIRNAKE